MLLRDLLVRSAREHPNDTAITWEGGALTFQETHDAVAHLASQLTSEGIRHGDFVAVLMANCPGAVIAYYAVTSLGAIATPANPALKPAELEYMWRDCGVSLVLVTEAYLDVASEAAKRLPGSSRVVEVQAGGAAPALGAPADPSPMPTAPIADDDCAVVIYTSGTTGHPKGAMLSHRNLTRNVEQIQAALEILPGDAFITVLPLFHSFAATVCMNTPIAAACPTILLDSFTPAKVLEAISTHRGTIFCGVPAMFSALLLVPPERVPDTSSLRLLVSGGSPLAPAVLAAVEERFGVPLIEGDGPTECSPATSVNPPSGVRKPGSVGLPLEGVSIAIVDDSDNPVPVGEVGEIVVRGDNVMLGYLNQPEATAEAMRSGWYHTGDLGKIDDDGYVYIVDRKKDMVIVGGLNVYPREVEEVLVQHPAVRDAAVIGLPDARRGERVVAVVVARDGAAVEPREVSSFVRERLADYKVPRTVLIRTELPRGATGKVVKRLLRKELELETQASTSSQIA